MAQSNMFLPGDQLGPIFFETIPHVWQPKHTLKIYCWLRSQPKGCPPLPNRAQRSSSPAGMSRAQRPCLSGSTPSGRNMWRICCATWPRCSAYSGTTNNGCLYKNVPQSICYVSLVKNTSQNAQVAQWAADSEASGESKTPAPVPALWTPNLSLGL